MQGVDVLGQVHELEPSRAQYADLGLEEKEIMRVGRYKEFLLKLASGE